MSSILGKRALAVGAFIAVCAMSAAQSFGVARPPAEESTPAFAATADWAVLAVLVGGVLVFLLKPRRRYVASGKEAKTD